MHNYPFLGLLKIIFGILKNLIHFLSYTFNLILLIIIFKFIIANFIKGKAYLRVMALITKKRHYINS